MQMSDQVDTISVDAVNVFGQEADRGARLHRDSTNQLKGGTTGYRTVVLACTDPVGLLALDGSNHCPCRMVVGLDGRHDAHLALLFEVAGQHGKN